MKLGLVKWGGVPTAKMVGDGVVATWDVLCSQLEIEDGGQKPNLPEAGLHAGGARAARGESLDAGFVVTLKNEALAKEERAP